MKNRFRTIALAGLAGFVLAACGASSPQPEQSDEPSQASSQAPGASQGGPEPEFSEGIVADLEALIPDTVADLPMQKTSMRGNEYLLDPEGNPELVQFLQDLGVSPNDISVATGSALSTDFTSSVFMFVIRAQGADSNSLLVAFQEAMAVDASPPPVWTSANVAGKQVQVSGDEESGSSYLYAKGDIVFWIFASNPAIAEEVLSELP